MCACYLFNGALGADIEDTPSNDWTVIDEDLEGLTGKGSGWTQDIPSRVGEN
jgi:hypothetical protein